jgi:hypothetical protein
MVHAISLEGSVWIGLTRLFDMISSTTELPMSQSDF